LLRFAIDRNDEKRRRDNTERMRAVRPGDFNVQCRLIRYINITGVLNNLPILIQVNPITPTITVMRDPPIYAWVVCRHGELGCACHPRLARDDKTMVLVATGVY